MISGIFTYNDNSIRDNREYASTIYEVKKDGKTYYTYTKPRIGNNAGASTSKPLSGYKKVAHIHTHAAYDEDYDNNEFSPDDKEFGKSTNVPEYLVTPNGRLLKYNPDKSEEVISEDMPSDPNDPDRRNSRDPSKLPSNEPTFGLKDWLELIFDYWMDAADKINRSKQRLDENNTKKLDNGPPDKKNHDKIDPTIL